jgi:hypothetical protein
MSMLPAPSGCRKGSLPRELWIEHATIAAVRGGLVYLACGCHFVEDSA